MIITEGGLLLPAAPGSFGRAHLYAFVNSGEIYGAEVSVPVLAVIWNVCIE